MVLDTAHRITFGRQSSRRHAYSVIAVSVVIAFVLSATWVGSRLVGVGAGQVPSKQFVIIDTDPGIDDAVAILTTLGDPGIKVLAITCVRGNTDVPNVIVNALKLLLVAGNHEVPVYTGNNYGLIDSPADGNWFGLDGFGDLPFPNPPSPSSAQKEHAASFLARIVEEYPGEITILSIGPLTNIALALHLNPQFLQKARRLIILGGSIKGLGNVAPGVEFNFFMDPDAATIVLDRALSSRTPITLMPLETVQENTLSRDWRWNTLAKVNNSVMGFLNKMETKQQQMHPTTTYEPFDTFAAVTFLTPNFVVHSKEVFGSVENRGHRSQGVLLVDYMNITKNAANLDIVMEVNVTIMKQKMLDNLSNFK